MILTIIGPSCAGKTTLEKMLRDQLGFESVISTTTRPMREGEVDGANYHFIDVSAFDKRKENGEFVESVEFNGHRYGVSCEEVNRAFSQGKPVVIVVEPNGMIQIAKFAAEKDWRHFSVFICNPPEVIAERFLERFVNDAHDLSGEELAKSQMTYAKRLGVMMSQEVAWQIGASMSNGIYNMIAWNFDEDTSQKVVDGIKKYAIDQETPE